MERLVIQRQVSQRQVILCLILLVLIPQVRHLIHPKFNQYSNLGIHTLTVIMVL